MATKKKRRAGDWLAEYADAMKGLDGDGKRFHKIRTESGTTLLVPIPLPGTHERIEAALEALAAGDEDERLKKAKRQGRSAEANRVRAVRGDAPASESTRSEEIADATYEIVREHLPEKRPAWTELAMWLQRVYAAELVELSGKRGLARVAGKIVSINAVRHWRGKIGQGGTIPNANSLRILCNRRKSGKN